MAAKKKGKNASAKAKKPARKAAKKAAPKASKKPAPKPAPKPVKRTASAPAAPNPWKAYADALAREAATTVKVMRAFPADQAAFQPHPRSGAAMQLFHTFTIEQGVALMCVNGALDLANAFSAPPPASLDEAIAAFERNVAAAVAAARKASPATWSRLQPFFVGPKQMGQVPGGMIAEMMLWDQIHHRGQLSVYLRMAGGKVPSIYGPSADEPW
jgi:uncharacterized damage-inducible protein DinB